VGKASPIKETAGRRKLTGGRGQGPARPGSSGTKRKVAGEGDAE